MINTFFSTVDKLRLQVADENSFYGGSINSYNNFLTRFFARLFGKTIDVSFNGKIRTLNRKSYEIFLNNNGIFANKKNIFTFTEFSQTMSGHKLYWNLNGRMRDHLTRSKSNKLFKKLVDAMVKGNIDKSYKLTGQGAAIEEKFWLRNGYDISFGHIGANLPERTLAFVGTQYNPLLFAVKQNFINLKNFLLKIGANPNAIGETAQFNRTISHVENRYHVHTDMMPVYTRHRRHHHVHYVPYSVIDREVVVHYDDQKTKLYDHYLDQNHNFVCRAPI